MQKHVHYIVLGLLANAAHCLKAADLSLAGIFTDHAILQRNAAAPVWGWGDPGEQVTLTFSDQTHRATADSSGKWIIRLNPLSTNAQGQTLQVKSTTQNRSVSIDNVVIGDVWLCSGQSNMGWQYGKVLADVPELAEYSKQHFPNPNLRVCNVPFPNPLPSQPLINVNAPWNVADDKTTRGISAIGVLFGQTVQKEIGIPIGILVAAQGGTNIESWTPTDIALNNPLYASYQAKAMHHGTQNEIGMMYKSKINPIIDYAFAGVLWYQGEGNVWDYEIYDQKMAKLMSVFRQRSGRTEAPFLMTELAPLIKHTTNEAEKIASIDLRPRDSARARFGETLAKAAKKDSNAWTITITDAGEKYDIHPKDKRIPGARFSAMALGKIYQKPGIAHGPTYQSMTISNGVAKLTFDSVGSGLTAKNIELSGHKLSAESLEGFEIAGADRVFYRAKASIREKNSIEISHPDVAAPVAVRYAWAPFPLCNLYNTEGFATYPFRTDDWPWQTPAEPALLKSE
jgi:sialate O-acetylesterase